MDLADALTATDVEGRIAAALGPGLALGLGLGQLDEGGAEGGGGAPGVSSTVSHA